MGIQVKVKSATAKRVITYREEIKFITESGTWKVPEGVTVADICVVGPGADGNPGGTNNSAGTGGNGGNGGAVLNYYDVSLVPGESILVDISRASTIFSSTNLYIETLVGAGVEGGRGSTLSGTSNFGNGSDGQNGSHPFDNDTLIICGSSGAGGPYTQTAGWTHPKSGGVGAGYSFPNAYGLGNSWVGNIKVADAKSYGCGGGGGYGNNVNTVGIGMNGCVLIRYTVKEKTTLEPIPQLDAPIVDIPSLPFDVKKGETFYVTQPYNDETLGYKLNDKSIEITDIFGVNHNRELLARPHTNQVIMTGIDPDARFYVFDKDENGEFFMKDEDFLPNPQRLLPDSCYMRISGDGNTLVICSFGDASNIIHVYKYNESLYKFEYDSAVTSSTLSSIQDFDINYDGTVIAYVTNTTTTPYIYFYNLTSKDEYSVNTISSAVQGSQNLRFSRDWTLSPSKQFIHSYYLFVNFGRTSTWFNYNEETKRYQLYVQGTGSYDLNRINMIGIYGTKISNPLGSNSGGTLNYDKSPKVIQAADVNGVICMDTINQTSNTNFVAMVSPFSYTIPNQSDRRLYSSLLIPFDDSFLLPMVTSGNVNNIQILTGLIPLNGSGNRGIGGTSFISVPGSKNIIGAINSDGHNFFIYNVKDGAAYIREIYLTKEYTKTPPQRINFIENMYIAKEDAMAGELVKAYEFNLTNN